MITATTPANTDLLLEIEAFLVATGMGPTTFGKVAVGNSELVARLRRPNRRGPGCWPDTAERARAFMRQHRTGPSEKEEVAA